jgi:dienelactone hydrolase
VQVPVAALVVLGVLLGAGHGPAAAGEAETVHFPSGDGKTSLVGYLFLPSEAGPHPALVLLHGRSGPYSSTAHGVYTAATLSGRHASWAAFWVQRGYVALLVDSFGPRGYPAGFPRNSYRARPAVVSEQTVRPLDAYGALAYLQTRPEVSAGQIGLQGWSNGAMTTLVTMSDAPPGLANPTPAIGFRAALALYPGCGMEALKRRYVPYAPVLVLLAAADDEVSPQTCQRFADRVRAAGGPLDVVIYEGAEHNFDDPGPTKQRRDANHRATEDARTRAERFFAAQLQPR